MGYQIIKQPNNLFCIWSTICDDFIVIDADEDGLIEYYTQKAIKEIKEIKENIKNVVTDLNNGKKPYGQYTMTYDEAVKERDKIHKLRVMSFKTPASSEL